MSHTSTPTPHTDSCFCLLDVLKHSAYCIESDSIHTCEYNPCCQQMKQLLKHVEVCGQSSNCVICKDINQLLSDHAKDCTVVDCRVFHCEEIKKEINSKSSNKDIHLLSSYRALFPAVNQSFTSVSEPCHSQSLLLPERSASPQLILLPERSLGKTKTTQSDKDVVAQSKQMKRAVKRTMKKVASRQQTFSRAPVKFAPPSPDQSVSTQQSASFGSLGMSLGSNFVPFRSFRARSVSDLSDMSDDRSAKFRRMDNDFSVSSQYTTEPSSASTICRSSTEDDLDFDPRMLDMAFFDMHLMNGQTHAAFDIPRQTMQELSPLKRNGRSSAVPSPAFLVQPTQLCFDAAQSTHSLSSSDGDDLNLAERDGLLNVFFDEGDDFFQYLKADNDVHGFHSSFRAV